MIKLLTNSSACVFKRLTATRRYNVESTEILINTYSKYKQTPISIKQFTDFGKSKDQNIEFKSLNFLVEELPIRLAHMTKEIDNLPDELLLSSHVQLVRGWYVTSFSELVEFPRVTTTEKIKVKEYTTNFRKTLERILSRHSSVVVVIAKAIHDLKRTGKGYKEIHVQYFLDRFYMSRIGIRMLISQHIETSKQWNSPSSMNHMLLSSDSDTKNIPSSSTLPRSKMIGVIDEACNVIEVVEDAVSQARYLCEQYYFRSPEVNIIYPSNSISDLTFSYIPSHLYHMFFELLKNSMRATVETHGDSNITLPPVQVIIVGGTDDLTIKISDQGGGIPRSGISQVFTYLYTTALLPVSSNDDFSPTDMNHAPMAGFGYGLPVSRLYARYMGGDLQLISMEGYGTDAFIYLKKSARIASEVLPEYSMKFNLTVTDSIKANKKADSLILICDRPKEVDNSIDILPSISMNKDGIVDNVLVSYKKEGITAAYNGEVGKMSDLECVLYYDEITNSFKIYTVKRMLLRPLIEDGHNENTNGLQPHDAFDDFLIGNVPEAEDSLPSSPPTRIKSISEVFEFDNDDDEDDLFGNLSDMSDD